MRSLYLTVIRHKGHFAFILAIITSLSLLFSNQSAEITQVRRRANEVFSFIYIPSRWLQGKLALETENALLRARNMQLALKINTLLELEEENAHLRQLLDFAQNSPYLLVPAEIYTKGITPLLTSISIDVGAAEGLALNNPVVTPQGVIGKVILVGEHSAVVQLLSDPNFRISVRVLPAGAIGILRWLRNDLCEVLEVSKNVTVNIGDRVVTSSFSDIYPENLFLGTVTAVYDERASFHKRLTVKMHSELGSLRYVFVIIGTKNAG